MGSQQETHKEVRRPNASAFATRWLSLFGSQSGHSKWSHICWPGDVWKAAVILKANTIETIHHAGGRIHLWILAVSRVSRIRGAASSIYPQWWTGLLFRVVACWSRRFYLWPKFVLCFVVFGWLPLVIVRVCVREWPTLSSFLLLCVTWLELYTPGTVSYWIPYLWWSSTRGLRR